jgi:hypothetical protein
MLGWLVSSSVGVGTGGSLSGGNGSALSDAEGSAEGVTTGALVLGGRLGSGIPDAGAEGDADRFGRGRYRTSMTGSLVRPGADPMPPAPVGGLARLGRLGGPARVQPTATAIGNPNATSPKKMDLGDNRTSGQPGKPGPRLRPVQAELFKLSRSN